MNAPLPVGCGSKLELFVELLFRDALGLLGFLCYTHSAVYIRQDVLGAANHGRHGARGSVARKCDPASLHAGRNGAIFERTPTSIQTRSSRATSTTVIDRARAKPQ